MSGATAPTATVEDLGLLDFEPPCEHDCHTTDTAHHGGDAAWVLNIRCQQCGRTTIGLVCDPWRQTISMFVTHDIQVACPRCHQPNDTGTAVTFQKL